ncbi:uncharacterized protein LOC120922504 [Rana temporaria]|uniref:uncharacterized protein LOC120922504 n=1 Tax=Rana temporaria TaxID=8407 RepID=UPI001AAC68EB|nr:uncharacterized protein LOC120922504 [Rana temporaria]
MKTFIFTFFLLAGHSFWETKAQGSDSASGSQGNIVGLNCLGKIVEAAPNFATDLVDFICAVYNSDSSSEDKAAKIVTFVKEYGNVVDGCDLRKILGLGEVNLVDVTADSAQPIVETVITALDSLGLKDVLSLLCDSATCITKIVASLTNLLNKRNPTQVCKNLNKTIKDLIAQNCPLPKKAMPGAANLATDLLTKQILEQVGPLLETVCGVVVSQILCLILILF